MLAGIPERLLMRFVFNFCFLDADKLRLSLPIRSKAWHQNTFAYLYSFFLFRVVFNDIVLTKPSEVV